MIVLVTGSRKLKADALPTIYEALGEVTKGHDPPHTLIHGACVAGADPLAAYVANRLGWAVRPRPANWEAPCIAKCDHGGRRRNEAGRLYCPAEGNYRNQRMVDEVVAEVEAGNGPAVCVVLWKRGAVHKGTPDCLQRAAQAGIMVRRWAA